MDTLEKLKQKDIYVLLLGLILFAAFIIRLYYFFQFWDQALWYDEADYVVRTNVLAFKELVDAPYAHRKPVFMPFFWSLILKFGGTEFIIKFVQVIISTVAVYGMYLLGKVAYSKKVGLIAAALLTVFYLHLFFAFRIMLDNPAMMFTIFASYFFVKWYKQRKTKDIIFAGIFTGIAIQVFYIPLWLTALFLVFLVLTMRLKFLTNKQIWIALLALALAVTPWLLWSYATYGDPFYGFNEYSGTGEVLEGYDFGVMGFYRVIPSALFVVMFVVFIFGIARVLLDIFLNFKEIATRKTKQYDMDLFFLLFIAIFPVALGTQVVHVEPRYMLPAFIAVFLFMATGLVFIADIIEKNLTHKYAKQIASLAIVAFIIYAGFVQLTYASDLIANRAESFQQERYAALWLADNTERDESFITCNQQLPLQAYAGRTAYSFGTDVERADREIEEYKPKYLVIDGYFGDCAYDYPQSDPEKFIPVQSFQIEETGQPIILIYEIVY